MIECNLADRWNLCLNVIKDNIPEAAYKTWFLPIVPLNFEDDKLLIKVPSEFFREFLEDKYIGLLSGALRRFFSSNVRLMYDVTVDGGAKKGGTVIEPSTNEVSQIQSKPELNGNKAPNVLNALDSHLMKQYTFDSFVEGESNRLPRSVAEEVAKKPANTPFNPLFIYGPSGVGKTHLVNAIGLKIKDLHPELRVLYISAHLFQVQFVDSVRNNTTNDFIHFYQTIDVLIIDDIQEIAAVTKTQNTLFHIFNHLYRNNKQLIFTSDRSPVMLQGLQERLMTRFKMGMIAELEKPTIELRKRILRNKIFRDGLQFPDSVIDYIAENVTDSVRELEGVIISIMAHSTIYNKDIDLELTKRILQKVIRYEKKKINIDDILKLVCRHYGLELSAIHAKCRKSEVVQARQVAMYLAKKYTDNSISKIGQLIGNKNHATVIYAYRTVKDQVEVDKSFRSDIETIEKALSTNDSKVE